MRYETINGLRLPKIGFGTWNIGGGSSPDRSRDTASLAALRSALELGYTHFDTAEMYAAGHTEELLGKAIRESGAPRASLFITSKVSPEHLGYDAVLRSCEASLRRLGLEYVDLYLIHWPSPHMKLPDAFRALNKLVVDGKVRHLGVSNFDLPLLKEARELSANGIITNQVPYSLRDRSYVRNGVLDYCQHSGILLTAYSPLDVGHLKPSVAVKSLAKTRSLDPYQVALAWLVAQPCVISIPMSENAAHQRQNLEAADIRLTDAELQQLN